MKNGSNYISLGQASVSQLVVPKDKISPDFLRELSRGFHEQFSGLEGGDSIYLNDGHMQVLKVDNTVVIKFIVSVRVWDKLVKFLRPLCVKHKIPFVY